MTKRIAVSLAYALFLLPLLLFAARAMGQAPASDHAAPAFALKARISLAASVQGRMDHLGSRRQSANQRLLRRCL